MKYIFQFEIHYIGYVHYLLQLSTVRQLKRPSTVLRHLKKYSEHKLINMFQRTQ